MTQDREKTRLTLTPVEAAALVGCRAEWIREAVRRGELPARRFGNRIKISREALDLWLRGSQADGEVTGTGRPA
jgi:excisionase family DNA binding protein